MNDMSVHVHGVAGEQENADVDPFKMTRKGLFRRIGKGQPDQNPEWRFVCAPFRVVGRSRDAEGKDWGRMIRFRDADGVVRCETVGDAELHGDPRTLTARLASLGLDIERGRHNDLADYLNQNKTAARVTITGRTGWHELGGRTVYVMPDRTIGETNGDTVVLAANARNPFAVTGKLDEWRINVAALVGEHERGAFLLSAAFAAPLLKIAGMDGAGINFYGPSSCGKTTLLRVAASPWGRGDAEGGGYVRTWRSTANGLEGVAAIYSDAPLTLDEVGVVDSRDAGAAIYQLATGQGKGRARRDGSLRPSPSWRAFVLSTGEMPMMTKLAEGKGRAMAGQGVRLIDVPADAGRGYGVFDGPGQFATAKALADALNQSARTIYGTAGPAFIAAILEEGLTTVSALLRKSVAEFRTEYVPQGADAQVLRAADVFGLVAAAGETATALGILPWQGSTATRSAGVMFDAWLTERGGTEAHEVRAAIGQVRAFIEAHGDSRFEDLDGLSPRPVINRAGYRKGRGREQLWYVLPEAWKSEVAVGQDPKRTALWLHERGMLVRAPDGFQCVQRIDGRPQRVYVLTARILENGAPEGCEQ
jgi:putative DNA primase/helicase